MTQRHFYGFEAGEAEAKLGAVVSSADPAAPAVHRLHDAIALPGIGGLHDGEGRLIDKAGVRTLSADAPPSRRQSLLRHEHGPVSVPDQLEVVEEPVLFGGHLMKHYGHFLIESMSRLWARDLFPSLPILFTNHPKWHDPSFGMEVIDALGLRERILLVDKPTIFREVVCPGTAFEYRWKAFSIAAEPHTAVTEALDTAGRRTWRQPVYLTRSGLSDDLRKSEAEPELERELSRRGFEVVRAETLPLADQIGLFDQSPLIIGTIGSALHTALFSRSSQTRLGILNWGRGFENYLLVDAVKQHTSYYLKSIERRGEAGEHVLDVGRTLQLLEDAGLIAEKTRPK